MNDIAQISCNQLLFFCFRYFKEYTLNKFTPTALAIFLLICFKNIFKINLYKIIYLINLKWSIYCRGNQCILLFILHLVLVIINTRKYWRLQIIISVGAHYLGYSRRVVLLVQSTKHVWRKRRLYEVSSICCQVYLFLFILFFSK